MKPVVHAALFVLTSWVLAVSAGAAAGEQFEKTSIPHLDGTGRATIVEIDPRVPGAPEFIRAKPEPIPKVGELIVPSRPTPTPSREAPSPE